MKKFTVLANCQSQAIAATLNSTSEFIDEYSYLKIPPVHLIKKEDMESVLQVLNECDLIISQPIMDKGRYGNITTDTLPNFLKVGAKLVTFPSLYFSGYFPTYGVMEGVQSALNGIHCYYVVASYLSGASIDEVLTELEGNSFALPSSEIHQQNEASLIALKSREESMNINIPVSDFIRENLKNIQLFNQFNHPTGSLIQYVCKRICNEINILAHVPCIDILDEIKAPIYQPVIMGLDLNFVPQLITNDKNTMALREMIEQNYKIYNLCNKKSLLDALNINKKYLLKYFELK